MNPDRKLQIDTITDLISGADGGVAFIRFLRLVEEMETKAARGDRAAHEVLDVVRRFARLVAVCATPDGLSGTTAGQPPAADAAPPPPVAGGVPGAALAPTGDRDALLVPPVFVPSACDRCGEIACRCPSAPRGKDEAIARAIMTLEGGPTAADARASLAQRIATALAILKPTIRR